MRFFLIHACAIRLTSCFVTRVAAVDALEKIRMMRDGEGWCEALVGAFRANARRMKTPVTEGLEWQCGHGGGGACSLARSGVAPGN